MRSLSSHLGIAPTAVLVFLCSLPPLVILLAIPTASAQTSTPQDRKAEADRLLQQGKQQLDHSQYQAALQSFQQASDIYQEIGDRSKEGTILNNIGVVYRSIGQYPQALQYFQQALSVAKETGNQTIEGAALNSIGVVYNSLGQYQQAFQYFQQALLIAKNIGDRLGEGTVLNNLGFAYNSLGQYSEALKYYQQALSIRKEVGDRSGEAVTLDNIGGIYSLLGQYQQAIEYYQEALPIAEEIGDRAGEGIILSSIGGVYISIGQYSEALQYYQQALSIAKDIGDRAGEGTTLNNIGIVYNSLGQYSQALQYYQQALSIAKEIGNRAEEGTTLNNIGEVYGSHGQYSEALQYYQQALSIIQEIGNRAGEGTILNNIGFAYNLLGQYPQALEYLQQSLSIAKAVGDRLGEGRALSNIGSIYQSVRRYPEALQCFQQALSIAKEIGAPAEEGRILNNIGEVYQLQGQYPEALQYFQQALSIIQHIGDRFAEGTTLNDIGGVHDLLGEYPEALQYYQQALSIIKETGDRAGEGRTLNNMGFVLFETGKFSEATETLVNAVEIWESLRPGLPDTDKISLVETQRATYRFWQQALVAQGKTEEALEVSERGRARAFVEQLAQRLGSQTAEDLTTRNIPTLEQLKQIAQAQNATLVEYSIVSDKELYIWVVKPTGKITFQQKDLSTLNTSLAELVDSSRTAIGVARGFQLVGIHPRVGTEEQQAQRLKQLYQLLIQPIADQLPDDPNAPVIFVPQDELFPIPFVALQDAAGQYLIEQHTVLTSPSIQILDKTRQLETQIQQANLQDVLVVGNPTMPRVSLAGEQPQQLISLAGAEKEANAIAPLLHAQPLLGGQAKKATVMQRMEQARMIHLATHGILDDRQGLESAIALAPDGTGELNDGLLTAAEIAQMKLHAELVVLSACDTAQGRITGDGVIGLSRALITAGVPSVLVSLWSVPDAPTAELMTEFYQQLQHTDNKAQALRQAMLATKAKHPSPRDWAGFTLIGEAQ